MRPALVVAGVPNPVGWLVDQGAQLVGGVAGNVFETVVAGIAGWVTDAVVWVVGGVFEFFMSSTDPNVQADWFLQRPGPYATTLGIAGVLLVGFVLIGVAQGVVAGDVGGLVRRMGVELPLAVVAMVGLASVTQALIALTDALSRGLLERFEDDVADFTASVVGLSRLAGGVPAAFVVVLLGVVTAVAGIIVVAELVVRAALVYIVVALAPLVFAAQLWPALRGAGRKLVELLVALVVSKLVIAVALAVAAAAAVGTGSGGEVTALAPPEVAAADAGGSVGQAVGILLAACAAFGVAAFSPLVVTRLLPFTEAAVVAQGIRSGPVRAGQQAMSASYYAQASRARLSAVAAQPAPGPGSAGAPGPTGPPPPPPAPAAGAASRRAGSGPAPMADRRAAPPPPRRPPPPPASRPSTESGEHHGR